MSFYAATPLFCFKRELDLVEQGRHASCAPLHVRLEFTEVCNFRCRFCWWHGDGWLLGEKRMKHTKRRFLPKQRAVDLIDEMADTGTIAVSFTGAGDPLMYPYMKEVLSSVIKRGLAFGVTSNFAMPLSEELRSLLCKAHWLRVSMNAATQEGYLAVHNPKGNAKEHSFGRMKTNVLKITQEARSGESSNFAFNGSYVVCDTNWQETFLACYLAKDLGLDSLSFRPDIPLQKRQESQSGYRKEALALIEDARKEIEDGDFKVYANEMMHENNVIVNDPDLRCFYMNHTTHIDSSGDVYPCCFTRFDPKYIIGNVMSQSFHAFWKNEDRSKLYAKFRQDFCPPCTYGRYNQGLKSLYNGSKASADVFRNSITINPFV